MTLLHAVITYKKHDRARNLLAELVRTSGSRFYPFLTHWTSGTMIGELVRAQISYKAIGWLLVDHVHDVNFNPRAFEFKINLFSCTIFLSDIKIACY